LSQSDTLPTPVVAQGGASSPLSGQEAALISARQAGATVVPEKLVIPMQSGFGTQAWRQELGDRLVWLSGRQGQSAELILNPPSLGAVEVRLNMSGGEASAQFFSANPNVRDVLEAALPKLRELMGGAGIALGEATVSDQSFAQRQTAQQGKTAAQADAGGAQTEDAGSFSRPIRVMGTSLLDFFA
jgi:flagellar hook-length control protein FliK